jgi:hypothetical protein
MFYPLQADLAALADAGTSEVVLIVPRAAKLAGGRVYLAAANATGAAAGITVKVYKGASDALVEIATATAHATNDGQELTLTAVKTSAANLAADDRLTVRLISAGGDTAAAGPAAVTLNLERPINPE